MPPQKETRRIAEEEAPVIQGQQEILKFLNICRKSDLKMMIDGDRQVQNWASNNFLGIQNNEKITEAAIEAIRNCGVGACGPAGFYGSMDVHLELEKQIAELLNVEEAIVYSQGFMAVASVIPAFCKRGDIIVTDDGISFAGQTGLEISRSHVYFFSHNDMDDLERVLQMVDADCKMKKMPLSRRFILVEGLYAKHGDKCNLPEIVALKKKYKYRLILDETLAFGTLGSKGLGTIDLFGMSSQDVEIITGSFSASLGSSGGFCAGSHAVIDHQRLSSQAYCYSAALPALLAVSTSVALRLIQERPFVLKQLQENIKAFNSIVGKKLPKRFTIDGDQDSPLKFLRLAHRHEDVEHEVALMNAIYKQMRNHGYLLSRDKHVQDREKFVPPPSLKICFSAGFTRMETEKLAECLLDCLKSISV